MTDLVTPQVVLVVVLVISILEKKLNIFLKGALKKNLARGGHKV